MDCKREEKLELLVKEKMFQINLIKGKLQQASERIKRIEEEIEKYGVSGGFSVNEDMLEIVQSIWKHCHGLYWMNKVESYLKED